MNRKEVREIVTTTLGIMKRARARIAEPEHWCQGHEAIAADGTARASGHPEAIAWCALGALWAETPGMPGVVKSLMLSQFAEEALEAALAGSFAERQFNLAEYNDYPGRTHAEILELFDRAIAGREGEERL